MINAWIAVALKLYKERGPRWHDCHLVPQWCYVAKVERVIVFGEDLQESVQALHPMLRNLSLQHLNEEKNGPCKRFGLTPACFNQSNLDLIHEHFREDFLYVSPLVAQSVVTGMKLLRVRKPLGTSPSCNFSHMGIG